MGDVDGCLGRTVQVEQANLRQTPEHLTGQFGRQCFTAAHHSAQAVAAFYLRMGQERLQH